MSSRRIWVCVGLLALASGCSTGPTGPTAPNAVAVARGVSRSVRSSESDGDVPAASRSSLARALAASFDLPSSGPSVVTFPPRNEPLAFRTALETKYRDGLRRPSIQTYVDQEGTVVWTQEYLRYRVNLCSHADAVSRVMSQIDGQGIPATCGTANTATFPPRDEPLAFMIQLEAKYRDGLRRPSGPTFVDVEGNIVWTQEYLRYRVSSCSHASAQQKVFDQIDGRGVQDDCARRTDTLSFTLPAGSSSVVVLGPILAGTGPLEVALNFSGSFVILACVGTPAACQPMGGRPSTRTFNIPSDFPAGAIQARVYFNPNAAQPSGNASGTVSFTYNPL
jgi:hypothetical protein